MKSKPIASFVVAVAFAFTATISPALAAPPAHSQEFTMVNNPTETLAEAQVVEVSVVAEPVIAERDAFSAMSAIQVVRERGVNLGAFLMATYDSIQLHDPNDGTVTYPLGDWNFVYEDHAFHSSSRPSHNGVDMAISGGTPIFNIADGYVSSVGYDPYNSYGYHIRIIHSIGGVQVESLYAHMIEPPYFSQGETVAQGANIGGVGCTGECTGNHLHFEIRINGERHDPASWLELNAVR